MQSIKYFVIGLVLILLSILLASLYTVQQAEQAFVLRLGKIVLNSKGEYAVKQPGLHIKLPLLDQVKRFDMRLHTLSIESSRIVTIEQKDVIVDAFVKWRIENLIKYFKSTGGNAYRAESLLRQKLNDSMRAEFGRQTIQELISGQRREVMQKLREKSDELAESLGIKIIDVRIKRIDLPREVTDSVYKRMRSDREKEAALIRAQGKEGAEEIKSAADATVTVTLASASSKAKNIIATGQSEAATIYADAYDKNIKFYKLYKSLLSYGQVFTNKNNLLLITPHSEFFKYFNDTQGKMTTLS